VGHPHTGGPGHRRRTPASPGAAGRLPPLAGRATGHHRTRRGPLAAGQLRPHAAAALPRRPRVPTPPRPGRLGRRRPGRPPHRRGQRGHTLATCTQADLDVWLSGPTTTASTRRFIRWTQRGGLCPGLQFPTRGALAPAAAADADRRTTIARTLLTQPHIPTADRVAGLLVTVYGQHLSRLVALRTSDLARRSDVVCLSRGTHWLKLPDPLGTWAWDLRDQAGHSSVQPPGDAGDRWLFPGSLPGRPLRPASLGNRLRRYGITARAARNDALTDVAAAVAPITLASLLDMHPNTANTWAEASSGSWARYLDDLLDDHDDGATDYQQAHP
jgi:hypothetical protein